MAAETGVDVTEKKEDAAIVEERGMRRVLIVGGGVAGLAAARELRRRFRVTVVDAKEYFEFTPSIMRAYVDPSHWDSITFIYKESLERLGVGFIWGEVKGIDGENKCARIKTMFATVEDVVPFDYCLIANGCFHNPWIASGESPWFPSVHEKSKDENPQFPHLDQRYLEGRRRRILEEHSSLVELDKREGVVLVVGAGYAGVQWACELQQRFPRLHITITDFLPRCCASLPEEVSRYCEAYMQSRGIRTVYNSKYAPKNPAYWSDLGLNKDDVTIFHGPGVKQSNYFMPQSTLSKEGPGGSWIKTNVCLQVVSNESSCEASSSASQASAKTEREFGDGCIFAVGDCILGEWNPKLQPPGKTVEKDESTRLPWSGYVAEQQAVTACQNIIVKDRQLYAGSTVWLCCIPFPPIMARINMKKTWYPWGSGILSMSLGPDDGCVVIGNIGKKPRDDRGESSDAAAPKRPTDNCGRIVCSGQKAAAIKELIETTKVSQCRGDHCLSSFIWYLVHHCPLNLTNSGAPCLDIGLMSSQ